MELNDAFMHNLYETLEDVGFSNYEARAYCALLANSPANGYTIAKDSGVPRGKIYETLERLLLSGAIIRVESKDSESKLFSPVDPESFIKNIEETKAVLYKKALKDLKRFRKNPKSVEILWRVTSFEDLISRGQSLTEKAVETLHVAIWHEEFDALLPLFIERVNKGVKIALVLYSPHNGLKTLQDLGTGSILHSRSKRQAIPVLGRQFVLVRDRTECITGSIFLDDMVEGVYTLNKGLVTNAIDLVNHEIYLERICKTVGKPIFDVFGEELEHLDAFDPAV